MTTIFYDSLCLVCNSEIKMLRKLDKKQRLSFIDITSSEFRPEDYQRTIEDFIGTIHGTDDDGNILTGMDVFRLVYCTVGLGWLLSWTAWPLVKPCVDLFYKGFTKLRPYFSSFDSTCTDRCGLKAK